MKLICVSCFLTPILMAGGPARQASDMVVCTTPWAGYALATGDAGASTLRCDYCGGKLQWEHHHLAWYGY